MIRCDEQGIPKIVQSIRYDSLAWHLKLFSGQSVVVEDDRWLTRSIDPMDSQVLVDLEDRFLKTTAPTLVYTDVLPNPYFPTPLMLHWHRKMKKLMRHPNESIPQDFMRYAKISLYRRGIRRLKAKQAQQKRVDDTFSLYLAAKDEMEQVTEITNI